MIEMQTATPALFSKQRRAGANPAAVNSWGFGKVAGIGNFAESHRQPEIQRTDRFFGQLMPLDAAKMTVDCLFEMLFGAAITDDRNFLVGMTHDYLLNKNWHSNASIIIVATDKLN